MCGPSSNEKSNLITFSVDYWPSSPAKTIFNIYRILCFLCTLNRQQIINVNTDESWNEQKNLSGTFDLLKLAIYRLFFQTFLIKIFFPHFQFFVFIQRTQLGGKWNRYKLEYLNEFFMLTLLFLLSTSSKRQTKQYQRKLCAII